MTEKQSTRPKEKEEDYESLNRRLDKAIEELEREIQELYRQYGLSENNDIGGKR